MPTVVKIKILDNIQLRKELDTLYDKATKIEMCQYSLVLCSHILSLVTFDDETIDIIQEGITINKMFQENKARMHYVRQASLKIHAHAKAQDDVIKQIGLRVIGHAIASAHMKEHAMVASDYAINLDNLLFKESYEQATELRLWQIKQVKKILNYHK